MLISTRDSAKILKFPPGLVVTPFILFMYFVTQRISHEYELLVFIFNKKLCFIIKFVKCKFKSNVFEKLSLYSPNMFNLETIIDGL